MRIQITPELKVKAEVLEASMENQKKTSNTTRDLNDRKNYIGALGQLSVVKCLRDMGLNVGESLYFDPDNSNDECDLTWYGRKIDVKSSPGQAFPKGRVLIKNESKNKKVDDYIFVKISGTFCDIVGVMEFDKFWRYSKPFNSPNLKLPCRYVTVEDLTDLESYINEI